MVQLDEIGKMITIILIIAGSLMSVLSIQEPGETFGLTDDLNSTSSATLDISGLFTRVNSDINGVTSSPNLFEQISFGADAIFTGTIAIFTMFAAALTNWIGIVELIFSFARGTSIYALKDPVILFFGIVMLFTIVKFLGDIVSKLPFFGRK